MNIWWTAHRPRIQLLSSLMAVALVAASTGCSSLATFQIECDSEINDGQVLTIDFLRVNDRELQDIHRVGSDWFTSPLRRELRHRTETVAVEGGCRDKVVQLDFLKEHPVLVVISEYGTSVSGRADNMVQVRHKGEWKAQTMRIWVHGQYLTIERR